MLDEIRHSLLEVGLSHKEADVYLALLELGQGSIQQVADRAGVNRSTTYLTIDVLQKRGLVMLMEKGKKTFYVAEHPDRILSLVVEELSGVEAKRERVTGILPKMLALFNAIKEKPRIRFFEGADALDAVRQEIVDTRMPVAEIYAVDESALVTGNVKGEERIQKTRKMRGRLLMAVKQGFTPLYFDITTFEARQMPYEEFPFSGSLTLFGNKLVVLNTHAAAMGIVVESTELTGVFRALFEAAWRGAQPWKPPLNWKEKNNIK